MREPRDDADDADDADDPDDPREVPTWTQVLALIVGAVLVLVALAALTPTFLEHAGTDLEEVQANFSNPNVTTGEPAGGCLGFLCAFAPVLGIVAVVSFLGLVFAAWARMKDRHRGDHLEDDEEGTPP